MICRGIVEKILSNYQVAVRIPLIHQSYNSPQSTKTSGLPTSSICTIPGAHPNIQVGDIVIVGFENNDEGKPIILGYLYKEQLSNTALSLLLRSLEVSGSTKLPSDTTIGSVSKLDLENLSGTKGNLQKQIDNLKDRLYALEQLNEIH